MFWQNVFNKKLQKHLCNILLSCQDVSDKKFYIDVFKTFLKLFNNIFNLFYTQCNYSPPAEFLFCLMAKYYLHNFKLAQPYIHSTTANYMATIYFTHTHMNSCYDLVIRDCEIMQWLASLIIGNAGLAIYGEQ